MTSIDWPTLINWIVSGFIGCVFGLITGFFVFRLERIRDKESHEKEMKNLQLQFENDKAKLIAQFENDKALLQVKMAEENRIREEETKAVEAQKVRESLLVGVTNAPEEVLKILKSHFASADLSELQTGLVPIKLELEKGKKTRGNKRPRN